MADRKPRSFPWIGVVVLAVLGFAYVLSVGPAFRWLPRSSSGKDIFETAYAPLLWVAARSNVVYR